MVTSLLVGIDSLIRNLEVAPAPKEATVNGFAAATIALAEVEASTSLSVPVHVHDALQAREHY